MLAPFDILCSVSERNCGMAFLSIFLSKGINVGFSNNRLYNLSRTNNRANSNNNDLYPRESPVAQWVKRRPSDQAAPS